jgi:transposase-like protein
MSLISARPCESREVARVLLETTKMEQRYDAVLAVIRDGLLVSEVAEKFGVSPGLGLNSQWRRSKERR